MQNFVLSHLTTILRLYTNSQTRYKHICDPYPHSKSWTKSTYIDVQMGLENPCGGFFELVRNYFLKEEDFSHLKLALEFCHH